MDQGEYDDFDYEDGPSCPRCSGFGTVDCRCGGDLCVCTNYGERDCPLCHGEGSVSDKAYDDYFKRQREMAEVMRATRDGRS